MMVAIYEAPLYRSESAGRTRCLAQRAPCYAGRESDRSKPACHEQRAEPTAPHLWRRAVRSNGDRYAADSACGGPAGSAPSGAASDRAGLGGGHKLRSRERHTGVSIRLSDLLGFLLLPALLDRLRQNGPGIAVDVLHLPPAKTVDGLEKDER